MTVLQITSKTNQSALGWFQVPIQEQAMLAELFMLRLEAAARAHAQAAGTSDTRFVPLRLPANPAKPTPTKTGEARAGE